ncbi:hypothetical protein M153_12672000833, partial [Pseudoloma neurophilia]
IFYEVFFIKFFLKKVFLQYLNFSCLCFLRFKRSKNYLKFF